MASDQPGDGIHLLVSGRVQGVGFRYFLKESADRTGVAGWVRNLRDGRVEAVLQGAPAAVQAVLDDARRGPPAAQVAEVITRPALAQELALGRGPLEVRRTA